MSKVTASVYVHGGDYDCSELVRMCYRAANVLPYGSYCWTGNELELLATYGFRERSLSAPKPGDVLWRAGHTELYLGNGMQGGARISEHGTIDGTKGDQTGGEIARSTYRPDRWTKLMRYEGTATVGGIPAAYVAVRVADHLIDHAAHGYSQPHRAGDGTIETITITWEDGNEMTEAEWTRLQKLIDARLDAKLASVPARVWGYRNAKVEGVDAYQVLRDMPKRVWGFRNKELEARDAYQILRDVRTTLGVEDGQTLTDKCVRFAGGAVHRILGALGA